MLSTLKRAWLIKDIRHRIIYTITALLLFQIIAQIPFPGINASNLLKTGSSSLVQLMNLTTGGSLANFGLFALGASPYITASIIIQLLSQGLLPKLTDLSKQGKKGQEKLANYTRVTTLIIGFFQGFAILSAFDYLNYLGFAPEFTTIHRILVPFILASTSLLTAYIGECINENGIGNGLSLIIASGILVQIPQAISSIINDYFINNQITSITIINTILLITVIIGLILFTISIQSAETRLPLQSMQQSKSNAAHYLPIKLMAGSVIPIIFASSIFTGVNLLFQWFEIDGKIFQIGEPIGTMLYALLILLFAYFYNVAQINPEKLAENLEKSNMYIQNTPLTQSSQVITRTIIKVTHIGGPALTLIAIIPIILTPAFNTTALNTLTGTGLLIIVGVFTELYNQISGLTKKHEYPNIY